MQSRKYTRLTLAERIKIETLLSQKKNKTFIANYLDRSPSTISREVNKWVAKPLNKYNAKLAHWLAQDDYLNKRNFTKIQANTKLRFYVYRQLLAGLSPELITGRLYIDFPHDEDMRISHESIYAHIYKAPQARLNKKLIKLLVRGKSRRFPKRKKRGTGSKIKNQTSIDLRPKSVDKRLEVGHWEGDLIIGQKQGSAIATLVERKTRLLEIIKIPSKKSAIVTNLFAKVMNKQHHKLRKTLTYDNGIEMAMHEHFTKKTNMKVYFAHPYSSWERGTNENTNGIIRRYFPKGTNFNQVSQKELQIVQNKINNRPKKVLGFLTPNEALNNELYQ